MHRAIALCLLLLPLPGLAEQRLGLVIGNDGYAQVPALDKARADAEAVSARMTDLGFDVIAVTDADRRTMNRRISEFTARLEPGDTAFLFFAGHGVEIDGENYLLPTDIAVPVAGEKDFIKAESIALSQLLDRVRGTGARTLVAVIDACRNNPFQRSTGRSIGRTRGLGRISAPQGTFVIFSAGAGQLALDELTEDDPAENSVFTRTLLPLLDRPGLELRPLMAQLRVDVRDLARTVSHDQVPAYYDELLGQFYFAPPAAEPAATPAPDAAAPSDRMRADFELARSIGTPLALAAFLDRYADRSDAFTYQLARQLLDAQTAGAARDSTPPEPDDRQAALIPPADAAADVAPDAPPEPAPDRRAIIRDTQAALNAVGCDAGAADGVIGRRTRAAFAAFLAATGAGLPADALGEERARDAVRATSGTVCKPPVAAPATAAAPRTDAPATATAPAPAPAVDMAGGWRYFARCAFNTKVTGNVTYVARGGGRFSGRLLDSLGRIGSASIRVSGRTVTGTNSWPTGVENFSATLSDSGTSFSGRSSNGCRFIVRR